MIYAGPGRRLVGFIVDIVVLGAVGALLLPILGVTAEEVLQGTLPGDFVFSYLAVTAVYQIGFIVWRGQTPGKMAAKTKVVDEETGALPGPGPAAARWLIPAAGQFLPGVVSFVALFVTYGWLLRDPRRQGIHDKVARTVVVDTLLPLAPPDPMQRRDGDDPFLR